MGNAANSREIIIHADINQLVQVTEHADLREFGNTRQERKTEIAICTFQYPVESFQSRTVRIEKRFVLNSLQ